MTSDETASNKPLQALLWTAIAMAAAWFLVLRACWWEWSLNPQYSYGMLVPLLCVLLLGRRWPDRPASAGPSKWGRIFSAAIFAMAALLLAALQPVIVSNADWRMVPALAAAAGAAMTLCIFYLAGGTPWLRHFAFPVLFFLVAVPWPRAHENALMSWLMTHNSGFCAEALQWMGYPAEQRGNLIALPGSLLGVEEACSGIRSLQSGIMVALAIGEFFRLTAARRIILVVLALGAALAGNAMRSLTLSVAACQGGNAAVDKIHDTAGLLVLVGASALVLIAGKLLAARPTETPPHRNTAPPKHHPNASAPPLVTPACLAGAEQRREPRQRAGGPLSALASIALVALWALSFIGGEAWFRWHESHAPAPAPVWTLDRAQPDDNSRPVPVAENTLDILLRPDTALSEQWRDDNGWQWQSFYFRWLPGPTSVQSAFVVHDPRVCLGAAGFELETKLPDWTAEAAGFRIPFRRYLFLDRGRPVHVFHAVVEDDGTPVSTTNDAAGFDAATRWENLRQGRRNRGLRVLELAVRGPQDPAAAEAQAAAWLQRRIIADPGSDK